MLSLNFGQGQQSSSIENQVIISDEQSSFDWLLFFDSRGLQVEDSKQVEESTLYLLKSYFDNLNQSYLIVSRPLYLTIFPSLVQFLAINTHLKFDKLITNMGFVDTTPKKTLILDDTLNQLSSIGLEGKICEFEPYELSNGVKETLSTVEYTQSTIKSIAKSIGDKFSELFLINTPIIKIDQKLKRKRPHSFYSQLEVANRLIREIAIYCEADLIDLANVPVETYDGVHYTLEDHNLIFNATIQKL